jgi:hypothetical protein
VSNVAKVTCGARPVGLVIHKLLSQPVFQASKQELPASQGETMLCCWQQQKSPIWCEGCKGMDKLDIEMHYITFSFCGLCLCLVLLILMFASHKDNQEDTFTYIFLLR